MSPDREPHADLIRVVAIWAVVLGHWYLVAVTGVDGAITGRNALADLGWAHPVTWALQVMPLFFFVGGYANAGSLDRHLARGGDRLGWVIHRFSRLVPPAAALLAVVAAAVVAARVGGVGTATVGRGAWVATVPLWFLAVYLAVVTLVPLTRGLQRHVGWAVPAVLVGVVALLDLARFADGAAWWIEAGYLIGWLAIHQVGVAWYDGALPTRVAPVLVIAGGGVGALWLLTVAGPYPVSMVNVPGPGLDNADPPTLALLTLAVTQIAVVLALRGPATRWSRRPGARRLVAGVHGVLLTVFCWHMAAAVTAAVVLYGGGVIPVHPIGSAAWLWWRVPWILGCAAILAVLVGLAAPIERWSRRGAPTVRVDTAAAAAAAAAAIGATLFGLGRIAVAGSGVHGPLALPSDALMAVAVGVVLIAGTARRTGRVRLPGG